MVAQADLFSAKGFRGNRETGSRHSSHKRGCVFKNIVRMPLGAPILLGERQGKFNLGAWLQFGVVRGLAEFRLIPDLPFLREGPGRALGAAEPVSAVLWEETTVQIHLSCEILARKILEANREKINIEKNPVVDLYCCPPPILAVANMTSAPLAVRFVL